MTAPTSVHKDGFPVWAPDKMPDLGSLGLKPGYSAVLRVANDKIISVDFSSSGKPSGPSFTGAPGPLVNRLH